MNELSTLSNNIEFITNDGIQLIGLSNINECLSTHHTIYKIHNLENGKYYIGQHITTNIFDTYMGSGLLITNALNAQPLSSFIKEILYDFDNFDDMNNMEHSLVPLISCHSTNPMCYNLKEGGKTYGKYSDEAKHKMSEVHKGKPSPNKGKKASLEFRNKVSIAVRKVVARKRLNGEKMIGTRVHSKEENERHSQMMKGKMAGNKHPLYGTHRSPETKAKLSKTLKERKCSVKEKIANYKKSPKDWMSPEQYEKWRANKKNRKLMTNGEIRRAIKREDFDKYLAMGFHFLDKQFELNYISKSVS